MYGHPLARDMENWHKTHNGDHESPEWAAFLDDFSSLLAGKSEEMLTEHSNEDRFGMSKAGGCTRQASLKLLDHEREELSGSSLFTFWLGHMCEIAAVATLRQLGYTIEGTQVPVRIDPFMHSFSDGLITSGPDYKDGGIPIPLGSLDRFPTILSVKSTGYKKSGKERRGNKMTWVRRGFPELPFEGVKKSQASWWAQAQAEMHGSGIKQTILVAVSKDIIKAMEEDIYIGEGGIDPNTGLFVTGNGSLTFYTELIPYDQRFCEKQLIPVWDEQWKLALNGDAGPAKFFNGKTGEYVSLKKADLSWQPNAGATGTFNPCAYCDMLPACNRQVASEWRQNRAASLAAVE